MNLPQDKANDRRSVPRHIRDGEHDTIDQGVIPAASGRIAIWLVAGISLLAAGGIAWWFTRQ